MDETQFPNWVPLHLTSIRRVGPEQFYCAIFQAEGSNKFLPLWFSGPQATLLQTLLDEEQESGPTPTIYSFCKQLLIEHWSDDPRIVLSSYYEGHFVAQIVASDGKHQDLNVYDALRLAIELETQIYITPEILGEVAIHISSTSLDELFGVSLQDSFSEDDSFDDAEFEALLRELDAYGPQDADPDQPEDPKS